MYILQIIFILLLSVTIRCTPNGLGSVTPEDDVLYLRLESELADLEMDNKRIQDYVTESRKRLKEMSVSPKMYDIAKKDLYSKERFGIQVEQHIAYLKIKLNRRKQYFADNRYRLSKEILQKELEKHLIDQKANPKSYPWRETFKGGIYKSPGSKKP